MRKLALLAVLALTLVVGAAVAYAATDTTTYSASISPKKPGNVAYSNALTVRGPNNTQPQGASKTDLFFAKQLVYNGKKFPSPCKAKDIDGKSSIPPKCNKALIGNGTGTANAGPAGGPSLGAEQFTVSLYNANKGKAVLLVLNGTSPVKVQNRVITGTVKKLSKGKFGFEVTFTIPASLQTVPGTTIPSVITDLSTKVKKTVHGVGYVQLRSCPKSKKLPSKAVVHFKNGTTGTATSTIACHK